MTAKPIVALILYAALASCAGATAAPTPRAPATAVAAAPSRAATPTSPPIARATALPTPSPTPTQAPTPTPNPAVVHGESWVPPGVTSDIVAYARVFEYAPAGRPAGMDDPARGCDSFDETRPLVLLTTTLRIYNRSAQTMRDWYAYFFDASGQPLYTCHQGFEHMPDLPPDHYVDVTFGAFSEGKSEVRAYVFDRVAGRSNEVEF